VFNPYRRRCYGAHQRNRNHADRRLPALDGVGRPGGVREAVAVMDLDDYAVAIIVRERLAQMRAAAESSHLIRPSHTVAHRLRVAMGDALIRAGRRLKGAHGHGGALATRRRAASGAVRG